MPIAPQRRKTLRIVVGSVVALVAVAAIGVAVWLPNEEQLARRAEAALTEALGVPVTIGALHWQLLPAPMIRVSDVATVQDAPIVLRTLTGWPLLKPLVFQQQIAFSKVELDGATIPQPSMSAFQGTDKQALGAGNGRWKPAALPVQRAEFRDVTWIGRRGIALEFSGDADFDPGWRPRHAAVERVASAAPARLALQREGQDDRWQVDVAVADGTWNGTAALQETDGRYRVTGEFEPKRVEVRQLLEIFKRKSVIAGRASGRTTLKAEGDSVGTLVRSLHTSTRFAMAPATVLRFDLEKAIRTVGKEHDGTTPLDSLTGQVDTNNTADGIVVRYTDLKAKSGALTATGDATIANRQVNAVLAVDLVQGVVGVPLKITGPVNKPEVSVPAGAVVGAVAGTAVLPGIGTAIGARIGGMLGKIFGNDDAPAAPVRRR